MTQSLAGGHPPAPRALSGGHPPAPRAGLMLRLVAALAASVLVAGCGTRLSDARIEAAAGVGGGGGGGQGAEIGRAHV